MKVQITNEGDHYNIYVNGSNRPLRNMRISFISPFTFDDEDILNLIGEKSYKSSFQNGKYEFNVTKKHLQLITGERLAHTRAELQMYSS